MVLGRFERGRPVNKREVGAICCSVLGIFFALIAVVVPGLLEFSIDGDEDSFAQVGFFSARYDASVLSDAEASSAGLPDEGFETDTLEFPFLFPAQENYISLVLPISTADAEDLASITGDGTLSSSVEVLVSSVESVVFDRCLNYSTDILIPLETYFSVLESDIFPSLIDSIVQDQVDSFDSFFDAVHPDLTVNEPAETVLFLLEQGFENSSCPDDILAATASDVDVLDCLGNIFTDFPGFLTHVNTSCTDVTVDECFFDLIDYDLVNDNLTSVVSYEQADEGVTDLCTILNGASCTDEGLTLSAYLEGEQGLLTLFVAQLSEESFLIIAIYMALAVSSVLTGSDLSASLDVTAFDSTIPDVVDFSEAYLPCTLLNLLVITGQKELEGIEENAITCNYTAYFTPLLDFLDQESSDLRDTIDDVSNLYTDCASVGDEELPCSIFFARSLLNSALSTGLSDFSDEEALIEAATAECKEDAADRRKLTQAQVAVVITFAFYGVALILGFVGLLRPKIQSGVLKAAAGNLLLAAFSLVVAIMLARNAPVYDLVGSGADGNGVVISEGFVANFSIAIVIIALLGAAVHISAASEAREIADKLYDDVDVDFKPRDVKPLNQAEEEEYQGEDDYEFDEVRPQSVDFKPPPSRDI